MNLAHLAESAGYLGIFISVLIECGIVFGLVLPLPGFSLLFASGILASNGTLSLPIVIGVGIVAAISGYFIGYWTGDRFGRGLFTSGRVKQLKPEYLTRVEKFYERYGYATLIAGRFLPFIHTAAPIVAGIVKMPRTPFAILTVIGGIVWVAAATLSGYFLGSAVPNLQYYFAGAFFALIVITNLPPVRRLLERTFRSVRAHLEN